jgi:transposase
LLERAVRRGLARKPHRVPALLGVDEKAAAKGHSYLTVVCDLQRGTVECIGDERTQASLDRYFERFTNEERAGIKAVALDIWQPYLNSVREHLEDAESKIVCDRFHPIKHMGEAAERVRRREHRALRAEGAELLTGSRYPWLYAHENLPARHRERFDTLTGANLQTARAWAIKQSLRLLWS